MALRYFYEEIPELHIVGTGSLLEFTLKAEDFRIPVGRIQYIYMFPLLFGEFLNALGEEALYEHILNLSNLLKLPEGLHHKLVEYVRKFFILGGMPAVVNEYIQTRDVLKCQQIQHSIISTDDFSKYARESKFNYLRKVFNSVPSMGRR
jgi:predicted AAA+ superfamily ATPase